MSKESDIKILSDMMKKHQIIKDADGKLKISEARTGRKKRESSHHPKQGQEEKVEYLYTVILEGLSSEYFAYSPEKVIDSNVFDGKHCNCRADLTVIDEINKLIMHMEFKGANIYEAPTAFQTHEPRADYIHQLCGASCLLRYCCDIGKMFYGKKEFLSCQKYRTVYIVLHGLSKTGPSLQKLTRKLAKIEKNKGTSYGSPKKSTPKKPILHLIKTDEKIYDIRKELIGV